MKLLLFLEFHFYEDENGDVYTEVTADKNFWNRYLKVFDKVIVCARLSKKSDDIDFNKMLLSSRENVEFIGLPDFKGTAGMFKNVTQINNIMRIGIEKSDCIILRAPSPISMLAFPIVDKSKKPYSVELMMNPKTAYSKDALNHFLQPFIQNYITFQTKRMCLKANGVSYVTEKVLQNLYPCRAILNKKNSDYFFTSSYSTITLKDSDIIFREENMFNKKDYVLVHSGKMEDYRKGQLLFIKVLKRLIDDGEPVKAIMIGDGSKKEEFINFSKDLDVYESIKFTGWLSGFEEVKKELDCGDIFIFPTIGEGLPRTLIESMARGLVCISSPVDGVTELLDESYLANFNDLNGFYGIIKSLIKDKEKMLEISTSNSKKSKKYIDSNLMDRRVEFYNNLRSLTEIK